MSTGKPHRQEQQPASDEIVEVAPDILRLQLPIRLQGLGHVNTYALCDDRGVALVDPGMPGHASWRALVGRLKAAGYRVKDVHTVIVTHSHPDHFGGAGILRSQAGAEVITHTAFRTWLDPDEDLDVGPDDLVSTVEELDADPAGDAPDAGRDRWPDNPWGGGKYKPPLRRRMAVGVMKITGRRWLKAPRPNRLLDQDDVVTFAGREWVAVHTPGHTHDHLCLYSPSDGVVLSGDHVLPTITPHISGLIAGADPLRQFFDSLDTVAALPDTTLALPAHGLEFTDVAGRCHEIQRHHDQRLQKLRDASRALGEADVVELSRELFQKRSWGRMAESETFAHLEHLRFAGEMRVRRDDERLLYTMIEEPAEQPVTTG